MANSANDNIHSLVTDNIDIWTNAIKKRSATGRGSSKKLELTGIKKLRELILELAVRGKLVPQDANDESASLLLERISLEKSQMMAEGKLKKQKPLPKICENEKSFKLPHGWNWSRLGDIGVGSTGKTPSTKNLSYFNGSIQFIGPGQITPLGQLTKSDKTLTEEGLEQSTIANAGDILMVCIGGSIGKSTIAIERSAFNQQINAMHPLLCISKFVNISVSTNSFYRSVLDKSTGSATPIINRGKWEHLLIPVAPINEQHRIVAKVDELMGLCDQLESQTENSLSAHQTLVEVLLSTLTSSADAKEFQSNWARIADHFDTLFTTEHAIDQLKQSILQLAVMGKLVPQNPNDEPASKLLERIATEKAQLIADKKIKKQKALPAITDDEKPFELPYGWEWSRLGKICRKVTDGAHNPPPNTGSGYPMLSCKEVNFGKIDFTAVSRFVDQAGFEKEDKRTAISTGDILLNIVASIGRTAIVPPDAPKFVLQRNVAVLDSMLNPHYFSKYLMAPCSLDYYDVHSKGTAQKAIYLGQLSLLPIAIPPLLEQQRIAVKFEELITLCNQLKLGIIKAQVIQVKIAENLVEQAVK